MFGVGDVRLDEARALTELTR
jgi:hypothetical protein